MRKLAALAVTLLLLAPASADAAKSLSPSTAKRYAQRAAVHRQQSDTTITGWELSRGIRFDARKFVFIWYGQKADGSGCGAQLVVRYASLHSNKVIAYFRNEECS